MIAESLYRLSKRKSRQHLYALLAEAVRREALPEAASVLNVGAGGEIGSFLQKLGVRARSLDVDPRRNPDLVASVEAMQPVGDDSVDAVLCLEVLEHVGNPKAAVAEIWRVLRPGGVLIGSTPFLLGIHDPPNDFYRYTRHGLQLLFRDFAEVALRARNGYFAAAAVLVYRRFALDPAPKGLALWRVPLMLLIALELELLDRLLPSGDGTTGYFFVYRKPSHPTQAEES
jgi:SAM-dependent methyltransferase